MKSIISIGLNYWLPNNLKSNYFLPDCEMDADRVAQLYEEKGYEPIISKGILTPQVFEATIGQIRQRKLKELVVYFSGHGMQIPNVNGTESDQWEEALCLWNGERIMTLLDHDFVAMISGAAEKITVIMDCCHSGGMSKGMSHHNFRTKSVHYDRFTNTSFRFPKSKSVEEYKKGINFVFASVESQVSYSTGNGGAFTNSFLQTVTDGNKQIESIVTHIQEDVTFQRANYVGSATDLVISDVVVSSEAVTEMITETIAEQLKRTGKAELKGVGTLYIKELWGQNRVCIHPTESFFNIINS